MHQYRGDLHIHTVLSPCADLDMGPANIVKAAKQKHLNLIGITDHNSTRNCEVLTKVAAREGIFVLSGCEINTSEEIHTLAFFEDFEKLHLFQEYISEKLPPIQNRPGLFGFQVIVNEREAIVGYEDKYLGSAITASIDEVEKKVHELNGIFIPAHIDRPINSIYSQLGFLPEDLKFEALQISKRVEEAHIRNKYQIKPDVNIVRFSDAHYPADVGEVVTIFEMEEISFPEIKKALLRIDNRKAFIL